METEITTCLRSPLKRVKYIAAQNFINFFSVDCSIGIYVFLREEERTVIYLRFPETSIRSRVKPNILTLEELV